MITLSGISEQRQIFCSKFKKSNFFHSSLAVTIALTTAHRDAIEDAETDPRDGLPIRICCNLSPDGIETVERGEIVGTETVGGGLDRGRRNEEIGAETDRLGNPHRDEIETETENGTGGVTELRTG